MKCRTVQSLIRALWVLLFGAVGLALAGEGAPAHARQDVDMELVLAVDCSYSVDATEFRLQREGLAHALRQPDVARLIGEGAVGAIAVSVIQWSKQDVQIMAIPWERLSTAGEVRALADRIEVMPRLASDGGTSLAGAIRFSLAAFRSSGFQSFRKVIDISSDGRDNSGLSPDEARDLAVAAGVTINGLTILNEVPTLDHYFRDHVIGGPGAFVEVASSYDDFDDAVQRKLIREIRPRLISGTPPTSSDLE
ncbi:DUF1194 domain-containing protein [Sneathiella chinensis]|uniref:VWFA domain-containing protein n=1 Tax=Sneathiella chinensis TaxID=349750 RepID=A0ABQ5U332_9PROT|nr:DUF1194 domain-containing protein [Sneathiella chinensis]GLQ06121.1 hypothetical protein GCM10007924_13420 [Sneathiella chinensis]